MSAQYLLIELQVKLYLEYNPDIRELAEQEPKSLMSGLNLLCLGKYVWALIWDQRISLLYPGNTVIYFINSSLAVVC